MNFSNTGILTLLAKYRGRLVEVEIKDGQTEYVKKMFLCYFTAHAISHQQFNNYDNKTLF